MKTTFITASAGTGKTYRLTELLADHISLSRDDGTVTPSEVIVTTFTRKAAGELLSRTAEQLLAAGREKEADALQSALIGTVNSVASKLVEDYAVDLGVSPDLRVIDEAEQRLLFNAAAAQVLGEFAADPEIAALMDRVGYRAQETGGRFESVEDVWTVHVRQIVQRARSNAISPDELAHSCEASIEELDAVLATIPEIDIDPRESWRDELLAAVGELLDPLVGRAAELADLRAQWDASDDTARAVIEARGVTATAFRNLGKSAKKPMVTLETEPAAVATCFKAEPISVSESRKSYAPSKLGTEFTQAVEPLRMLQSRFEVDDPRNLSWHTFVCAARKPDGVKAHVWNRLLDWSRRIETHLFSIRAFREDLRAAVRAEFAAAERVLRSYEAWKSRLGVLDFQDQEALALRALGLPRVRESVGARFKLLAVDEFQDTSPLQLSLFLKLVPLVDRVIWVGDPKQSIYEFRGADVALMDLVVNHLTQIANGEVEDPLFGRVQLEVLRDSYRSKQAPLDLANGLFVPLFARTVDDIDRVALRIPEPKDAEHARAGSIHVWEYVRWKPEGSEGEQEDSDDPALATSSVPEQFRMVAAGVQQLLRDGKSDIAVLARDNASAAACASAIAEVSIPVVGAPFDIRDVREGQIVRSALACVVDPSDSLALAELVHLLVDPHRDGDWLQDASRALSQAGAEFHLGSSGILDEWRDRPELSPIREVHPIATLLTPVELVKEIISATGLTEQVRAWSQPSVRMGRLDALVQCAAEYEALCSGAGVAATPLGLLKHFDAEATELRASAAPGAVTVSTFHAAKGLDWDTVVVLLKPSGNAGNKPGDQFRSVAVRPAETTDFQNPLLGRDIIVIPAQHLPSTYWDEPLMASQHVAEAKHRSLLEAQRIHYVGLTRAKDTVALATLSSEKGIGQTILEDLPSSPFAPLSEGARAPGLLGWVNSESDQTESKVELERTLGDRDPFVPKFVGSSLIDGAVRLPVWAADLPESHGPDLGATAHVASTTADAYAFSDLRAQASSDSASPGRLPATFRASGSKVSAFGWRVVVLEPRLGPPLLSKADTHWDRAGNAIHAYLATPHRQMDQQVKVTVAQRIIERHQASQLVTPETLVTAGQRWSEWVEREFPGALELTEVPIAWQTDQDQRLKGYVDSLIQLPDGGIVLVDHKSVLGDQAVQQVEREFLGQLEIYRQVLVQAGLGEPRAVLVHLPLAGVVCRVSPSPTDAGEPQEDTNGPRR